MSNIIKMPKPYAHIGKRVLNIPSGKMGTIASAKKRTDINPNTGCAKKGWEVTIEWDDGRYSGYWTDRDISKTGKQLNKIVADDFVPDWGDRKDRIAKLIERIDKGDVHAMPGYVTEGRCGRDSISIWRPVVSYEAQANLYGGDHWTSIKTRTPKEAWADLRGKLAKELEIDPKDYAYGLGKDGKTAKLKDGLTYPEWEIRSLEDVP